MTTDLVVLARELDAEIQKLSVILAKLVATKQRVAAAVERGAEANQ